MKVYQTNEIKNIAILGSSGSGKTTLAEAMLYEGGVIKRRGSINAGNTVCDYFPVEKEYGYSVFSTVFSVEWQDRKLNFIDCPGSDDFIGGAVSALNVTDTALMVLNAQYGVEVGTINQFRYTEQFNKPVIFIVNHLDNAIADYDAAISQLRDRFGSKIIQIQYPINHRPDLQRRSRCIEDEDVSLETRRRSARSARHTRQRSRQSRRTARSLSRSSRRKRRPTDGEILRGRFAQRRRT